jgi:hypothetical protein
VKALYASSSIRLSLNHIHNLLTYDPVLSGTTIPVCFTFTLYFLIRNFKVIIHLHIWIGHILCRNCLLKHVIEGMTEVRTDVMGRRRRCKQLLDDLKETRRYWKLKEEALNRIMWRTGFGRDYRPVIRHPTE